jgi:Rrf2 family protein
MRLTTKGRFAVTAMIDLALRSHSGPVALAAISQRQQISLSYLEQLFGKLRRHELVESTRGPGGGYSLGRSMAEITVASNEQSGGIEQLNQAVNAIDETTQQNAALVEQAAAAAENLRDQAVKLSQAMSVFKISHGAPRPGASAAPRPSRAQDPSLMLAQ